MGIVSGASAKYLLGDKKWASLLGVLAGSCCGIAETLLGDKIGWQILEKYVYSLRMLKVVDREISRRKTSFLSLMYSKDPWLTNVNGKLEKILQGLGKKIALLKREQNNNQKNKNTNKEQTNIKQNVEGREEPVSFSVLWFLKDESALNRMSCEEFVSYCQSIGLSLEDENDTQIDETSESTQESLVQEFAEILKAYSCCSTPMRSNNLFAQFFEKFRIVISKETSKSKKEIEEKEQEVLKVLLSHDIKEVCEGFSKENVESELQLLLDKEYEDVLDDFSSLIFCDLQLRQAKQDLQTLQQERESWKIRVSTIVKTFGVLCANAMNFAVPAFAVSLLPEKIRGSTKDLLLTTALTVLSDGLKKSFFSFEYTSERFASISSIGAFCFATGWNAKTIQNFLKKKIFERK